MAEVGAPSAAALASAFPIRVEHREGRGRGVVAVRDIIEGEVILASQAAAFVCIESDRCSYCVQPGKRSPAGGALKTLRCNVCKTSYCSKECQAADWKADHKAECKRLAELDTHPDAVKQMLLLLGRLYRGSRAAQGADGRPAASGAISFHTTATGQRVPYYVHSLADVRAMQLAEPGQLSPGAAVAHGHAVSLGTQCGLLPLSRPEGQGLGGAGGSALTETDVRKDLRAFDINNFTSTDEAGRGGVGLGVYPVGALLNHACDGNAGVTYAYAVIRALRRIRSGEEVCHTYVEPLKARLERRSILEVAYGFSCTCGACEEEGKAEVDGGVAEAVRGPPPPRPPSEESAEEVEANLCRARLMATRSEAIAAEPQLEMSRGIKARMREEGTPVEEDYDRAHGEHGMAVSIVHIQTAVLVHALKLFRRYLPPFHPDVVSMVGVILATASMVDDFVVGEAAASSSVANAAGCPTLRATPCHPIRTLQEYSAVDRYLEWANSLEQGLEQALVKDGFHAPRADGGYTASQAALLRGIQGRRVELAGLFVDARTPGEPSSVKMPVPAGSDAPNAQIVFTPSALRAHAAALLPELLRKMRVAFGDCRLTRQLVHRVAAGV